ncbi:LysR family substrate-binding domain-containing protein [Leptodesmis sp.]|uniref:LysR family substrate-binding domain-containing protein n=1 Tax=Leptodesmis sp. TaxID=3100501 RepID=UPI00405357E1
MLARQARQGLLGQVTIGLNNAVTNSGLSDVIKTFQQKFPNVQLILREVPPEDEVSMLKQRQLDLIFLRSPSFEQLDPSILCCKQVLQEYFVAALPTGHPLAAQSKIALSALQNEAFILPPIEILPFYERVIKLCQATGFEPHIVQNITVTGAITLLNLVAAGTGISILPNHVQTLKRDGVIYRPIVDATALERQIAAVWRKHDDSIVVQNFLQVLRESPLGDGW